MEAVFLHQRGSLRCVKPFGFSLLLLRPIVKLTFHPKREDAYLTKAALLSQLLFILLVAGFRTDRIRLQASGMAEFLAL